MTLISKGLFRVGRTADPRLRQALLGCEFENPLGLAAGFDKNGVATNRWHGLGFGFAEIGTITWHAQPGNPVPRLFRLPEDKAIINRMGFNNLGAARVAANVKAHRSKIPLGVNLGKSKVTPLEQAADDYYESCKLLSSSGDYYVMNVSSPNTPGLRTLQDKAPLLDIVSAAKSAISKPLFVKVAPDLEDAALDEVAEIVNSENLAGIIATNTTVKREHLTSVWRSEAGGLSGLPVQHRSTEVIRRLRGSLDSDKAIIGVGGIFTGKDLLDKMKAGADLTQIYTGWVYRGPASVPIILRELLAEMDQLGVTDLLQLKGRGKS